MITFAAGTAPVLSRMPSVDSRDNPRIISPGAAMTGNIRWLRPSPTADAIRALFLLSRAIAQGLLVGLSIRSRHALRAAPNQLDRFRPFEDLPYERSESARKRASAEGVS